MKKIILWVLVCMVLLCGCSPTKVEKTNTRENNSSMFVIVEETSGWKIVYHKDTKVMYSVSTSYENTGTFTLLVNADGTPMIYKSGVK